MSVEKAKIYLSKHPLYQTWCGIRQRCNNPKCKRFSRYGGRGIKVCERWDLFENFLDDMGPRPEGFTIERVNNDGNYEPSNCCWASRKDQNKNTSACIPVEAFGSKFKTINDASREHGLHRSTVKHRISRGLTPEEALTFKSHQRKTKTERYKDGFQAGVESCEAKFRELAEKLATKEAVQRTIGGTHADEAYGLMIARREIESLLTPCPQSRHDAGEGTQ
jgi:hypothetical protein